MTEDEQQKEQQMAETATSGTEQVQDGNTQQTATEPEINPVSQATMQMGQYGVLS